MKNVIDYNKEELEFLTLEELKVLFDEAEKTESLYNTEQLALKIMMNALYGALANKYFPLFNEEIAAAITGNGRYFIQKLANNVEQKLQSLLPSKKTYILYGDTDSIYYHIEPFMDRYQEQNPNLTMDQYVDWADNFEKKVIQPVIQQTVLEFSEELNAYNKDVVGAEREIIADCVAPNTVIKIKQNNCTKIVSIANLARMYNIQTNTKTEQIVDLTNENIEILSYNEKTKCKELKQVLNIQKKVTTKDMLTLIAPNGKKIIVTEDHKIAVKIHENIVYKQAKDITEDDDVIMFDSNFYTRDNQELYGVEYINHGSTNCDLRLKGKAISKSKQFCSKERLKNKKLIFDAKINKLILRFKNNYFKFIFRFADYKHKTVSINNILRFVETHPHFKNIDLTILKKFINIKNRKKYINQYILRKKYGKSYFRRANSFAKASKNGFLRMSNRANIINGKIRRALKQTPLHTAKAAYRNEVYRYTKLAKINNIIPNIEKTDKYNYNLDHIVPIMYGFNNNVPVELIGDVRNLLVIRKLDNIQKRCNIDYNVVDKELFKGYI